MTSCATVPITERRQLTLYPESVVNRQAARAYERFKLKAKLIKKQVNGGKLIKNQT